MKLFEISNYLDTRVPLAFQEEYDNCGLLIGNKNSDIHSVLICLDCTEAVLDEAIGNKHNLIISHHPVIFNSVKKSFLATGIAGALGAFLYMQSVSSGLGGGPPIQLP